MKREGLSSMSFERAAWTGKLNRSEYIALASWYGGMLLVMFYGITLSNTVVPDYLGLLIWVNFVIQTMKCGGDHKFLTGYELVGYLYCGATAQIFQYIHL